MLATGVFLALNMSCKMVGLLMFLTVGSAVCIDLWNILDVRRGYSMVGQQKRNPLTVKRMNSLSSFLLPFTETCCASLLC